MPTLRAILRALAFCTAVASATHAQADPLWGSFTNWASYGAESTAAGGSVPTATATSISSAPATASSTLGTLTTAVPGSVSNTTSVPASTTSGTIPGSAASADAYINFTTGPYPEAGALTSAGAQAWYFSPVAERLFGGIPSTQQQADFTSQVLKDVNQTFALSGLAPVVTTSPATPANHVISVVSNASYSTNPNAAGVTDVGHNGFAFLDKLSPAASETDLEWALAHVISHELMHAFGVAVHHDQTGNFLDTATATWSLLTNPKTVFSPAAVQDILAQDYSRPATSGTLSPGLLGGDLTVQAQPVPEPAAAVLWTALGAVAWRRRRRRAARPRQAHGALLLPVRTASHHGEDIRNQSPIG